MNKAVFLDRDGTIVEDNDGYINNPSRVKILPLASEAIKKFNEAGFKVIVITNQSGIGRGYFDGKTLGLIHQKMIELLAENKVLVDDIFYCPHIDEDRCTCRKPLPGMIAEAVLKHDIDLAESWAIGDSERDIAAGKNAGCRTILISNNKNAKTEADYIAENLEIASSLLTSHLAESSQ